MKLKLCECVCVIKNRIYHSQSFNFDFEIYFDWPNKLCTFRSLA